MPEPRTTASIVQRFCRVMVEGYVGWVGGASLLHLLDPLGPPLGRFERLGEVVGLLHDLAVLELEDADGVVNLSDVVEGGHSVSIFELQDGKVVKETDYF